MGITGLIPFLEKSSKRDNINRFSGGTVAIDSYCWLHKGAFSCADKLFMGQSTNAYVTYCMKFVDMLLANRIKPILVFDGCHLPAKAGTEAKRRKSRETNRQRAVELMRMGQTTEGRNLLRRSIDITHKMALDLIKQCQERNIDCIVAPYEADAQLAYLNISGIADVVITEDSDLTLFGCKKIFFKMDINGNGILVEQDRLHLAMGMRADHFDIDKFRYMCILSGCDYLASLPGIGLTKACKFIMKNTDSDIHKALIRLPLCLNMKALDVSKEYRDAFLRAVITYKHQVVFCPLQRKQIRLTPPTPDVTEEQLHYAGDEMDGEMAWQLALGNCDPFTMKKLHDFNPDITLVKRTNSWKKNSVALHISIWSKDFKIRENALKNEKDAMAWPDTAGKVMLLKTSLVKKKTTPQKRDCYELQELIETDMLQIYGCNKSKDKSELIEAKDSHLDLSCSEEENTSPVLIKRSNPFVKKKDCIETSPSLLKEKRRPRLGKLARFRRTVIDDDVVMQSKFFASPSKSEDPSNDLTLTDINSRVFTLTVQGEVKKLNSDKCEKDNSQISESLTLNNEMYHESLDISEENKELQEKSSLYMDKENENLNEDEVMEASSMQIAEELNSSKKIQSGKLLRVVNDNFVAADQFVDFNHSSLSNSGDVISKTSSDITSERSFNREGINNLSCNTFEWEHLETNEDSSSAANPVNAVQENYMRSHTSKIKRKLSKGPYSVKRRKVSTEQSQQRLLSMYGFQRKAILKH